MQAVYFLIVVLILNTVLFFMGNKVYFGKYSRVSLDYDAYLLADSHGMPLGNILEKCGIYNFSMSSDSYDDMYIKLKFLLDKTDVETIYITADDHTLSPYRETGNTDRSKIFRTEKEFDNHYEYIKSRYIKRYLVFSQPKCLTVIISFILSKTKNGIKSAIGIKPGKTKSWAELSIDDRIKNAGGRMTGQFPSVNYSINVELSLLGIITICKQNNIRLIGIKFPLSSEYITILGDKTYGADTILRANGIDVLDYKNLFIDKSEYFADQDHLNELGGKEFAEILLENSNEERRNLEIIF
ncbi:hypothetical protein AGMMS49940_09300 [Spirochaetia bacterium]|nr:hypothetical protein AGMMS49940_09300 [Spirochaetia bacterium]